MNGPCDWPTSYAACVIPEGQALPAPLSTLPASGAAQVEEMAAAYLWNWTGQSLGLCEVTVRPCREDCSDGLSTWSGRGPVTGGALWRPAIIGGRWYNIGCGYCSTDSCSCTYVESLRLPGPISSVVEVVIDGEILPAEAYRIDRSRVLVRQDGGAWPTCNDLSQPLGEPGTWSVTYVRGVEVPVGGQIAAGVLAVELAKAICRDQSCQLPQRVQTVTRQGVTIAMLDAFDDVDKGHTGIFLVDSWVSSLMNSPRAARVYSPDLPRRTTFGGS